MNTYILIAGVLCVVLGLIHSILGEVLIFNPKRHNGKIVPTKRTSELREKHLRIIWATWHLASVFGWCIGAILVKTSLTQNELSPKVIDIIIQSSMYGMFAGSLLVLVGTKGRHPGWIVLLLIGILSLAGRE